MHSCGTSSQRTTTDTSAAPIGIRPWTSQRNRFFPDAHAAIAQDLIASLTKTFGAAGGHAEVLAPLLFLAGSRNDPSYGQRPVIPTMSEFPEHAFSPTGGTLGQLVYENPAQGIAPRLDHSVEISFEPFSLEDEEVSPVLWLSGIRPGAKSWLELRGSTCPADALNHIDGSLRLFGEMNPAEISKLEFHEIDGATIAVELEAEIDFEMGAGADYGVVPLTLKTELSVGPLRIATSIDKRLKGDDTAIASEISTAVDLSAYGGSERVPGGMAYPLKA